MLVIIKLRARIYRASNTKPQQLRRFAVDRLMDRDVASRYYDELEYDSMNSKECKLNHSVWMKNVKNWKKQSRE
jgi:hypothetical protein